MTAEEERRAQLLAAELAEHDHLVVALDPVEALSVIGMLQLALRHPSPPPGPSQIAVAFIERVVHAYGLRGPDSREFARVVAEGWPGQQPLGDLVDPRHPERLGCRCPDPLREVHPACPWHGHSPASTPPLIPPHIREAMAEIADRPLALERLFPIEVDDSIEPGVIEVRGETTTVVRLDPPGDVATSRPPAWRPPDVVRPVGLVWSGIRVDEFEGIGYTITEPGEDGPLLEPGEIYGVPLAMTIYVWSRADFDRLAALSRALHDARRGRVPLDAAWMPAMDLLCDDSAEALAIARALPAGE